MEAQPPVHKEGEEMEEDEEDSGDRPQDSISTVALQNNTGEKDSWGYYCMGWVPRGVGGLVHPAEI